MLVNMSSCAKQAPTVSTATPRTLLVQKFAESRAAELKTLQSIVASRLDNDFRSQRKKRRRTTDFDNRGANARFKKKRKAEGLSNHKVECDEKNEVAPRHVRRRTELRQNPVIGFSTSGDGTKWLRTHVWHAKRFTMTKRWGFHLPLHTHGRGRGSRALLKKLKCGVLVHDASYYSAVQLEGPELTDREAGHLYCWNLDILLIILNSLLVPSPSSDCETTSTKILSGLIYKDAMLHFGGSTNSQIIAPVTYMWQPRPTCSNQETVEKNALCRKVWVWLHPAALREGYAILKHACETQTNLVTCISLEDHLAKVELIGSRAFELLQTLLHPATGSSENSWQLNNCSVDKFDAGTSEGTSILGIEDRNIPSTILTLTVKDPRMPSKEATDVCEAKHSSSFDHKQDNLGNNVNIWDASLGIYPPEEESVLCDERHYQHMQSYRIFEKTSKRNASDKGKCSRLCPIMLLKNHANRGSIKGWSIILPLSWTRTFWIPLVSLGSHAIGLREKHWIACDVGLPNFPSDFPDSNAYSSFMALKASISHEEEGLRPPSMRPLRVPVPPPWGCVRLAFLNSESNDIENQSEVTGTVRNESSVRLLDAKESDITPFESHGSTLGGFVARTSDSFIKFLDYINGTQLLLFPKVPEMKKSLSKCMRDEKILEQLPVGSVSQISSNQGLCFLRVLLHAYKEGAFEDGAVVCAPHVADIISWVIRSGEENHVQMPLASLGSLFVQQPSGEWELELPGDPLIRESFRWPIGFVTTGFVRGSKKPTAIALCEATLLAQLREEQWRAVLSRQRRREIYVLVRNLRSTAYRLALATIILEKQEEDVECM
ncbi:endoribonuclease [Lithospermum erythrorhizon]|uniref:Endoribonuclease n=1 Tax=Lithospermum erythrorhizon TaxID=34254 RepID=A0AAV3Q225_LITER